jgi:hypothetical protein
MNFAELEKTDVTGFIEKKGRFSYLSWPFAVSEFRKKCPNGYWRIGKSEDGKPYFTSPAGSFVSVTVYPEPSTGHEGRGYEQVHPVLDNKNNTVKEPNAFQINTSIQRCLVKAIALATGIGLHIYAGEDLPPDDTGKAPTPKKPAPKKTAPKQGPVKGWTKEQNNKLVEMAGSLGMTRQDGAMLKGYICQQLGIDTWDDIPGAGKAGMVINNFSEYFDAWKLKAA